MNVYTLAIGDHVYGLVALCNSLCAAGFDGQIHVGYQGDFRCEIASGAPIILHELPEDELQPMNRKPAFLLDHAAGVFLYLDADIVVMKQAILDALSDRLIDGSGILRRRDCTGARHQTRRVAQSQDGKLGESSSLTRQRCRRRICTSTAGLVCGDMRRDRRLISDWNRMIRRTLPANGDGMFEVPYFPMPDQDCLNALLQDEEFGVFVHRAAGCVVCDIRRQPVQSCGQLRGGAVARHRAETVAAQIRAVERSKPL